MSQMSTLQQAAALSLSGLRGYHFAFFTKPFSTNEVKPKGATRYRRSSWMAMSSGILVHCIHDGIPRGPQCAHRKVGAGSAIRSGGASAAVCHLGSFLFL
mmetsp:Transcript_12387/g.37278  ORF Transcript_12387/g.37278 Transcript_12387/m.37278 type:complete len:100 (+) Transcript_12387:616-915(+)